MTTITKQSSNVSRRAKAAQQVMRRIAVVAMLGIVLGLAMQTLIILLRLFGASIAPGLVNMADVVQTVTWSVLVCTGVAVAMAFGKARTALSGLIAAMFAPLALAAAKSAQKVMLSIVDAAEQPGVVSLTTVSVVRALEYGILAWILAWLVEHRERRLMPYAAAGGVVALLFGGALLVLNFVLQGMDGRGRNWVALGSMAISELGSPVGCALVIYVAQVVTANSRLWARSRSGIA